LWVSREWKNLEGRYGRKLRILNSAIILGYNLIGARHVLYVSYQLLLF